MIWLWKWILILKHWGLLNFLKQILIVPFQKDPSVLLTVNEARRIREQSLGLSIIFTFLGTTSAHFKNHTVISRNMCELHFCSMMCCPECPWPAPSGQQRSIRRRLWQMGCFCGNLVTYGRHAQRWGLLVTLCLHRSKSPRSPGFRLVLPGPVPVVFRAARQPHPLRDHMPHTSFCCLSPTLRFPVIPSRFFTTHPRTAQEPVVTSNY